MSGSGQSNTRVRPDGDQRWANDLNLFFNRFDSNPSPSASISPPTSSHVFRPPSTSTLPWSSSQLPFPCLCPTPTDHITSPPLTSTPPLSFTWDQVRRELERLKTRKAAGPDGISPRLLRSCAGQLCNVLRYIFNLSLRLEKVPLLWKTSCVVPVLTEPNHYRPVALTSHLMKTMERLVLKHLRSVVSTTIDPLQFTYRPRIAIIYLQHRALTHLETAGSAVRMMFFDFSSAFNTIQPGLLRGKLERAGVDERLVGWSMDYLTNRPQYVCLHDCVSEVVVCSTGAPQGTVLSPFFFTLYFTYNTSSCHLQKYSDDSAIVGCVSEGDDAEYRSVIVDFVSWCENNHLCLNTSKTKEMVIDFCRRTVTHTPVNIQGDEIVTVDSFKYLGVHLNNKLDWSHNIDDLYKKGQSRLHLLRRLWSFGVCRHLLRTFYDSVVTSAVFYAVVCWEASCSDRDRKKINKLVRRASSVLGCSLDSVEEDVVQTQIHHGQQLSPSASDSDGAEKLLQQQTETPPV